jgi:hypothetical protein
MMDSAFKKCDMKAIVKLNSRIVKQLLKCSRTECSYEQALEDAFYIEDLKKNQDNTTWIIESPLRKPRQGTFARQLDSFDWVWEIKIKPLLCFITGIVATFLSFCIMAGELAILFDAKFNLFKGLVRTDLGFVSANVSSLS